MALDSRRQLKVKSLVFYDHSFIELVSREDVKVYLILVVLLSK